MRTKKITALVICVVLFVATIAGLVACSANVTGTKSLSTTKFNIDNYVKSYKDNASFTNISTSLTTRIERIFDCPSNATVSFQGPFAIISNEGAMQTENSTFDVYSFYANKMILRDVTGIPSVQSYYSYGSAYDGYILCVQKELADDYIYDYYLTDGTVVFKGTTKSNITATARYVYVYVDGSNVPTYTWVLVATVDGVTEKAYFALENDGNGTTFKRLQENSLRVYSSDYAIGQTKPMYEFSANGTKYPVESAVKDYQYDYVGNSVRFYKNGTQTGSIDCSGKQMLGTVDRYVYYYEIEPLATTATSGYNYCGENDVKAYYKLCRYDVLTNKVASFNYDVHITSIAPVYNKESKAYDGAYVTGYKKVNGVYYDEKQSSIAREYNQKFTYLTNSKLEVGYDLSEVASSDIVKLTDNRYLARSQDYYSASYSYYLMDDKLNVIPLPGSNHVFYPEQGLVKFYVDNNFGFADFEGKVVIAPKYSGVSYTTSFNNGYMLMQNNETNTIVSVSSTGEEKMLPVSKDNANQTVTVSEKNGYYHVKTIFSNGVGKSEFYLYDGTLLKSFEIDSQKTAVILNSGIGNNSSGIISYTVGSLVTYYNIIVKS